MPPASCPTASIFCAWVSRAAISWRWVMSVMTPRRRWMEPSELRVTVTMSRTWRTAPSAEIIRYRSSKFSLCRAASTNVERGQAILGVHQRHPEPGLHPLLARVAQQHLLPAAEEGERLAVGRRGLPHDRVQRAHDLLHRVGLRVAQALLLQAPPLGGLADHRHDRLLAVEGHRGQADLHRDLGAVVVQALQAQAQAHRPRLRVLGVGGAVAHVRAAQAPGMSCSTATPISSPCS